MSKSSYESKRDEARQARDEQEVRDALLGDGTQRNAAWLFEQLEGNGDASTAPREKPEVTQTVE